MTLYEDKINFNYFANSISEPFLDDSFLLCDLSDVIHKYQTWVKFMPRIKPFYAVKCNSYLPVLEILAKLGTGFDCASKEEIITIQNVGIQPEDIIFANPSKAISHIIHANNTGVNRMTFDNEYELFKIKEYYPKANLVLRIRCDAKSALVPFGSKFGCDAEKEAPALLSLAKSLNLNIIGVSFHVGSSCEEHAVYKRAIKTAKNVFGLAEKLGYNCNLLDIGGGFSPDLRAFKRVAEVINEALNLYFNDFNVGVIAEPGRFFVSSAFTLIAKIISLRQISNFNKKTEYMYFINNGIHSSFSHLQYGEKATPPEFTKNHLGDLFESSIWGQTCDPTDKLFDHIKLPKLNINDVLVFKNIGAYTISQANNFNGFPIPEIKMLLSSDHRGII